MSDDVLYPVLSNGTFKKLKAMPDGSFAEVVVALNSLGVDISGGGGGGSGVDRELVVSTYRCKTAFAGASVGDTITATQIIDVSGASPSTVSTVWRNQTTATDLGSVPSAGDLELTGSTALTDAQLRAAPVGTVATGFAFAVPSNILTRQANTTAYASGQIVGGSASVGFAGNGFTFSNIARVAGGQVQINRARLYKSQATAAGTFELAIFRAQPTLTIADAGAFASGVPVGNATANARLVARIALDMTGALVGSDGAELASTPISTPALIQLPAGASDLFAVLRATSAYTPLSGETFSVVLEGYAF